MITSPRGDTFASVRVPKDLARRLNVTLGKPLCSADELRARRAAEARLASLRAARTSVPSTPAAVAPRVAAPVMVYFEKGRAVRELSRVEEVLRARAIEYQLLDVAGDEATLAFVTRAAGCASDDLPVVFVAGAPIGPLAKLVDADVSGALARAIYG